MNDVTHHGMGGEGGGGKEGVVPIFVRREGVRGKQCDVAYNCCWEWEISIKHHSLVTAVCTRSISF